MALANSQRKKERDIHLGRKEQNIPTPTWKVNPVNIHEAFITEVLEPGDEIRNNEKANEAVRTELQGLFDQRVFEILPEGAPIPPGAVVLPSKMV